MTGVHHSKNLFTVEHCYPDIELCKNDVEQDVKSCKECFVTLGSSMIIYRVLYAVIIEVHLQLSGDQVI